jgi:hypothetical protein
MKQLSTPELVKRANAAVKEYTKLVAQFKDIRARMEHRNRAMLRRNVASRENLNRHPNEHGRD